MKGDVKTCPRSLCRVPAKNKRRTCYAHDRNQPAQKGCHHKLRRCRPRNEACQAGISSMNANSPFGDLHIPKRRRTSLGRVRNRTWSSSFNGYQEEDISLQNDEFEVAQTLGLLAAGAAFAQDDPELQVVCQILPGHNVLLYYSGRCPSLACFLACLSAGSCCRLTSPSNTDLLLNAFHTSMHPP